MFKHLKEDHIGYCRHFCQAWGYVFRLAYCQTVLAIHSVMPDMFTRSASTCIANMFRFMRRKKDRILIRFNTTHATDPGKRKWRLLINGKEYLAEEIDILVPGQTTVEKIASGEVKYHILCNGTVSWDGNKAIVY